MIDARNLDARLENWAHEYGGGKYENIGFASRNLLQTLIEHEGFIPSSRGYVPIILNTQADQIEDAVHRMDATGYARQSKVLRCEYFFPKMAMVSRLLNLKEVGVDIGRATYYDYLAIAKACVAVQLASGLRLDKTG